MDAILDAGLVAHVGFAVDGLPFVVPTLHARIGDRVYFHGSAGSRTMRALAQGAPACLSVSLIDAIVLARSAAHHSVNYRSVTVFGRARAIEDLGERRAALEAFTERLVPGRWDEVRPPSDSELKAVSVLSLPLTEASAKIRTGPPADDEPDHALPVWAGELPLRLVAGAPLADPRLGTDVPRSAALDRLAGALAPAPERRSASRRGPAHDPRRGAGHA
ncbi:MAG: pyridoxamine 5'-phosphate oxidase family protein [Acidobacteriota bacterium]|nr:pyridoxamine 5'-phosphate oxidase family protein [Acidobacteriota bacterium]